MCGGKKVCALVVLLLGIGLLLKDLGVWAFWNITPWTLVFLIVGICMLYKTTCMPAKGKKK